MIDIKNYKEMDCPICGKFHFPALDESDIDIYECIQCHSCGWIYDFNQIINPETKNSLNNISLNEFKKRYNEMITKNPDYVFLEDEYEKQPHICPICGKYTFDDFGNFEICPFCGWEDDSLMEEEPDKWAGCANDLCLNDYKKRYQNFLKIKPNYKYKNDGFLK